MKQPMTEKQERALRVLIAIGMHPSGPMEVFHKGWIAGLNLRTERVMDAEEREYFATICKAHSVELSE